MTHAAMSRWQSIRIFMAQTEVLPDPFSQTARYSFVISFWNRWSFPGLAMADHPP
jgi:hypothetical protein